MAELRQTKERLSGEERREQIIDIALRLFAEKGFNGTRTREIASAAGISETLIFQHFKTKKDLYQAALSQLHSPHPLRPEVEQQMVEKDDFGVFKTIALHIIRHGRRDPRMIRLSIFGALEGTYLADILHHGEGTVPSETQFLEQYIEQRIAEGAFQNVNAKITARLFTEAVDMYLVAEEALIAGPPLAYTDEEVVDTLVGLVLCGLKDRGRP